jgi:branched-chain amino acid transport system permease protein
MDQLWQFTLNGVGAGASAALLAFGFAAIFGATRIFHFAYALTYLAGGYVFYELDMTHGWPTQPAAIAAVLVAGLLGGAIWLALYRPLLRRRVDAMSLFLASLGLVIVGQAVASIRWKTDARRVPSEFLARSHELWGGFFTNLQVLAVALAALVVALGALAYARSRLGVAARALGADVDTAGVLGINVERTRLAVFVLGSAIGAIPATLLATDVGITPEIGFQAVLIAVIATFVGGTDSPLGAALAGFAISIVMNVSVQFFAPKWQTTVAFATLFAFMALRPQGILGRPSEARA